MKQTLVFAAILGFAASARLDHLQYLPPNQRSASSGAGAFGGYSSGGPQAYSANSLNQVPTLKFASDNDGEGTYRYNYETGNSISAEEQGDARGDGTKAHGSFSYVSPEGEHVSITYTADENGFVPQGSHIPTPPPVPEAILKALQENAAAEARGVFDDGQYHGEGLNDGQYKGEGQGAGAYSRGSASAGGAGGYAANGGYRY